MKDTDNFCKISLAKTTGAGCTKSEYRYPTDSIIFELSEKVIKSNYTRNIDPTTDKKSDFDLKILNFNLGFTSYYTCLESLQKPLYALDSAIYLGPVARKVDGAI